MFDQAKNLYQLQKKARDIKKKLQKTLIEAEHEGVTVTVSGEQKVTEIKISDEAMQDKTKLESSLEKALNKGMEKSQQIGASMIPSKTPVVMHEARYRIVLSRVMSPPMGSMRMS